MWITIERQRHANDAPLTGGGYGDESTNHSAALGQPDSH